MDSTILFEDIVKKVNEARQDLFDYNIETGIKKIIGLVGELAPQARAITKENELNKIAICLMTAMEQKDYLLFADIASFEIPALFDGKEI